MKIGVLASGSGTNLQALLDVQAKGELGPARIVVVGVNVPGCGALQRAAGANVESFVLSHKDFRDRGAFDAALADSLLARGVECVVMAGFMRLVGEAFLSRFPHGVINIHPALQPAFPGVNAQEQAFSHGVKFTGCSVHFVDAGVDTGPIIAQAVVPILPGDDAHAVQMRILRQEHALLPAVVRAHAEGRIHREGRIITIRGAAALTEDTALRSL